MLEPADPELYREVFGHLPTGVAVITAGGEQGVGGMTANAVCSLSIDPLLALVCFDRTARTLPLVESSGRFAINILRSGQEELAGLFASKVPETEKLERVAHRFDAGVPLLADALAWVRCDVDELVPGGDHMIAIGRVQALGREEGEPLLWWRGAYGALASQ